MITDAELIEVKKRLVLGAEAARKIANSPDPLFYDQETYESIYDSLVRMPTDVSKVLAELDVLRGMWVSGVSTFLASEMRNGLPVARGNVAPVPAPPAGGSGEGKPSDPQGACGGVPEGGVHGEPAARPKPRRGRKRKGSDPVAVGHDDGAATVDRREEV